MADKPATSDGRTARTQRLKLRLGQVALVVGLFAIWEAAALLHVIDASLFGDPVGIFAFLDDGLLVTGSIWRDTGSTLEAVALAFLFGSSAAIAVAAVFAHWPTIERLLEPIFTALNAMPRIALAPMFIIWFGLGIWSKVAVGSSLTFFIVLSATVAGIRSVSSDHLILARTLGADSLKIFRSITLPSAVPVVFSGLRLGLIYSILGVVGAEIIASRNGLGQEVAYMSSTFNIDGVMGVILLLAVIGYSVSQIMTSVERWLLRWQ
jgi:NitT/TauT family transport system permease protein